MARRCSTCPFGNYYGYPKRAGLPHLISLHFPGSWTAVLAVRVFRSHRSMGLHLALLGLQLGGGFLGGKGGWKALPHAWGHDLTHIFLRHCDSARTSPPPAADVSTNSFICSDGVAVVLLLCCCCCLTVKCTSQATAWNSRYHLSAPAPNYPKMVLSTGINLFMPHPSEKGKVQTLGMEPPASSG